MRDSAHFIYICVRNSMFASEKSNIYIFAPEIPCLRQKNLIYMYVYPIENSIYKYLSSKNTYIYALPPTIYSSLTHNAIDISHD